MAATAAIAGGGGLFTPGQTTYSDVSANALFGGKVSATGGWTVGVSRSTFLFEPEEGPSVERNATLMFISSFGPAGGGYGCFVIPDSAFRVVGIQSATLDATVGSADVCPVVKGIGAANIPAILSGGGGGGTLPPSFDVHVSWIGSGVVSTNKFTSEYTCLDYETQNASTTNSTRAIATGSITFRPEKGPSDFGRLSETKGQTEISGTIAKDCFF